MQPQAVANTTNEKSWVVTLFDNRDREIRMCEAVSMTCGSIRAAARDQPDEKLSDSAFDSFIRIALKSLFEQSIGEFDPGSGRTLAACLTHASHGGPQGQPANGCVTREQSA